MKIIIPMAGAGSRFTDAGYKINKAALPLIYRKDGKEYPMVVCSVKDLPEVAEDGSNVAFIMRDFHHDLKVDEVIAGVYPKSTFITVHELTEGQACTCLLATSFMDMEDELLIAACDNGIEYDRMRFEEEKADCDVLVFTYRDNPAVYDNPDAFGWVIVDEANNIKGVSVKKHISDKPDRDHAIVATFWFRKASIFVDAANLMIRENDRINNEFYVDEVIKHVLALGYKAKVFEVDRFLNYGAPEDYENYLKTIAHFKGFIQAKECIEGAEV